MTAATADRLWADLARIGRHPDTGGYRRYAIPSAATGWLDARGADQAAEREDCPAGVEALAAVLAGLVGDHP